MKSIKLRAAGNVLEVWERPEFITSGTVGLPVEISFDSQWDGLEKVVTFRAGERCITVAVPEKGVVVVPWELLEKPQQLLQIGLYGSNAEGDLVIPTLWAPIAPVYTGTDPAGDPALEPTQPLWQTLYSEVRETAQKAQAHTDDQENPHGVTAAQVGAAPSGFGCCESSARAQDWDGHYRNGFYKEKASSPDGVNLWYGLTCVSYSGEVINVAFNPAEDGAVMALRHIKKKEIGDWEYVNPPMLPGVEYRTAERWRGKPVYTKLIDGGEAINGKNLDLSEFYAIIRTEGCIMNPEGLPVYPLPNGSIAHLETIADVGSITLYCNDSISESGHTFCVQLWYVK